MMGCVTTACPDAGVCVALTVGTVLEVVVVVVGSGLSLHPNHPGVLHVLVVVVLVELVVDVVVVVVDVSLSRQPHHPGVLQVSVRVFVLIDVDVDDEVVVD